jgi:hypothetical protein
LQRAGPIENRRTNTPATVDQILFVSFTSNGSMVGRAPSREELSARAFQPMESEALQSPR